MARMYMPDKRPELSGSITFLANINIKFSFKRDVKRRPIHNRIERRVITHIFVAFMRYCLIDTRNNRARLERIMTPFFSTDVRRLG